jgi:hypothetical protein
MVATEGFYKKIVLPGSMDFSVVSLVFIRESEWWLRV